MNGTESGALVALFRFIVARRVLVAAAYAVLVPLATLFAARIESDSSIDRLIVQTDPDFRDNQEFQRLFPEGENVVLLAEARDPYTPEALRRVAEIESRLMEVPRVRPISLLSIFDRVHARPGGATAAPEEFRRFATGTDLFRKQGLAGEGFLGIPLDLEVHGPEERDAALEAIDATLRPFERDLSPLTAIRRIGGPYVDAYLEAETGRASSRFFPLFGVFVVTVTLVLFRSPRTLLAFLLTLAASVALTVGFGKAVGFAFTIVSSLVPLTILVTCTAALVYIQSRFVEMPSGASVEEHQVAALANKFVATTASIMAAAIGFAALAVSSIRPIRDMGLWVAGGLVLTWVVVFTLFPALQRLLKTPTLARRTTAGRRLLRVIDGLPRWSYRWRWVLLPGSLLVMLAGVAALTGVPGLLQPMALETDALDYIDRTLPIYEDTRRFEQAISGLSVVQVWVTAPEGGILDPGILQGLETFARALESDPRIGSVTGPTTMLRWMSYVGGGGDRLSDDPAAWPSLAAQLERLLLQEPALRDYVDVASLSSARLSVIHKGTAFRDVDELRAFVRERWDGAAATRKALAGCTMRVVGQGLLQAKIARYLVPTLTESFFLTAAIIFLAFLLVFRSGAARLMAMIPSVFAILAMFVVMRLCSIPLNVATILIASTVLGASENDQIHFFYHFQEKRDGATTEQALRHALLVAGRAILFATLINAGGFLALALSGLPPMRQFGIISASAFVLSMLASLTALPAALWVFFRERPDPAPSPSFD
jgi:predicted RND superfamily exporter protein